VEAELELGIKSFGFSTTAGSCPGFSATRGLGSGLLSEVGSAFGREADSFSGFSGFIAEVSGFFFNSPAGANT